MRAQSLWADLQSIPDSLFHFQGDSSKRSVRQIQRGRWLLEAGAGLACSKRDSRPIKRVGGRQKEFKEKSEQRKIRSRSKGSKKADLFTCRNSQTSQRTIGW